MKGHRATPMDVGVSEDNATHELRRRVPRHVTGWPAKCQFGDDPGSAWGECQVLDISILGAGLEIFELLRRDPVGREITVEAQTTVGGSVSIRFVGVIRNVRPGPQGGIRAGIEFLGLSETERTILDALEQMRVVW
jgi:hypothetical protein